MTWTCEGVARTYYLALGLSGYRNIFDESAGNPSLVLPKIFNIHYFSLRVACFSFGAYHVIDLYGRGIWVYGNNFCSFHFWQLRHAITYRNLRDTLLKLKDGGVL